MATHRLTQGLVLVLIGVGLIFHAFTMHTGDGMFGGIVRRAPSGVLGVIMFIPGALQIIRGSWDAAGSRKRGTLSSTRDGRKNVIAQQLTEIDQQLRETEVLATNAEGDDELHRIGKLIVDLRSAGQAVESKLQGGQP